MGVPPLPSMRVPPSITSDAGCWASAGSTVSTNPGSSTQRAHRLAYRKRTQLEGFLGGKGSGIGLGVFDGELQFERIVIQATQALHGCNSSLCGYPTMSGQVLSLQPVVSMTSASPS